MKSILLLLISLLTSIALTAETQPIEPTDTDGDGYINISTLAHLRWLSESPDADLSANYELDNDIDASETRSWNVGDHDNIVATPDSAMGWQPIRGFGGNLDGNMHLIRGIYINRPKNTYTGFFSHLNTYGDTIKNLGLVELYIVGGRDIQVELPVGPNGPYPPFVGGLAARGGNVAINNCFVTGTIIGYNSIGGLFAETDWNTRINSSYVNVHLFGNDFIGALVAEGRGEVKNCYARGLISGRSYLGGVSNSIAESTENVYSTVQISIKGESDNYGGLCYLKYTDIEASYWDIETSGVTISDGGEGRTTAQMKTQSNYVGWDFDNIWAIDPAINDGYPYLRGVEPISSVAEEENYTNAKLITVYPNPATTHISLPQVINPNSTLTIIGMDGVTRFAPDLGGYRIDVSGLPTGTYFLSITEQSGDEYLAKFIVD